MIDLLVSVVDGELLEKVDGEAKNQTYTYQFPPNVLKALLRSRYRPLTASLGVSLR